MMNFKKYVCCITMFMSSYSFGTLNLDFIDTAFDDFVTRINLPQEQRVSFTHYYARLTTQLNESSVSDRQILHGYFYQTALTALKNEHPDWYVAVLPFVTDPRITLDISINDVRTFVGGFLIRYGAYHEFCMRLRAMQRANRSVKTVVVDAWDDIGKRASSMKGTIKNWLVR